MEPSCPKCGAGRVYLHLAERTLQSGEKHQAVRCLNCGNQLAERTVAPVMAQPRAARAARETDHAHQRACAAAAVNRKGLTNVHPCPVPGCAGHYTDASTSGVCKEHGRKLYVWMTTRRTLPPPILRVNGFWFHRGQVLVPGIR